jgi:hypothetical protein
MIARKPYRALARNPNGICAPCVLHRLVDLAGGSLVQQADRKFAAIQGLK